MLTVFLMAWMTAGSFIWAWWFLDYDAQWFGPKSHFNTQPVWKTLIVSCLICTGWIPIVFVTILWLIAVGIFKAATRFTKNGKT